MAVLIVEEKVASLSEQRQVRYDLKVSFIAGHQGKPFDEGGGSNQGVALCEGRIAAAKIGVSGGYRTSEWDESTAGQFGQDGGAFAVAESGLGKQFFFGDDRVVDSEPTGIEQCVESTRVEIIDENVGVYED